MPLLLSKNPIYESFEVGFIPHWSEYKTFSILYSSIPKEVQQRSLLINFMSSDIEAILQQICKCKFILSSSLHGIILAHAYGIPALWIRNTDCGTDGFKFHDYFSSVNIPQYDGFSNFHNFITSLSEIHNIFRQNHELSLPDPDVVCKIQKELLESFPFKIKRICINTHFS